MKLCERITADSMWPALLEVAVRMVTSGCMAAMGYYRDALRPQAVLGEMKTNASTIADLQATSTILHVGHSLLSPVAGGLLCGLSYLGEETTYAEELKTHLSDDVLRRMHPPDRFFDSQENVLRIIFDGIDGTGNFNRGIPLFCTAAAILVDNQVRVSAIYDPLHNEVCSALLPGSYENPEANASASAWQVATGSRINLVEAAKLDEPRPLTREAIGIHLTRSHPAKLAEFLGTSNSSTGKSMLERLAEACGGIYALNSGIVAMREIAKGALGGFVNIITNSWDVAAPDALVRACGGKVTDFDGCPITYASSELISVVAAKGHLHAKILDVLHP